METLECEDEIVTFRAYRNLVYVERPADVSFQQMNLFIPCQYYTGGSINGYDGDTAPIFMPNTERIITNGTSAGRSTWKRLTNRRKTEERK